ncbi:MAG TPA: hypothetical protein VGR47_05510 [Terracidiphilus sp.]|nr:hypothetical protein [Terracidiphilus sp.]
MLRAKIAPFFDITPASLASVALLAFALAAFSAGAQEPPDSPPVVHLPGAAPPAPGAERPGGYVDAPILAEDPIAHENAAKLAEVSRVRQTLEQNFPKSMQNGLDELKHHYPSLDPRFVAEWEKRMRAEFNPDDYIAVFIRVYEEHYTAKELEEMMQALRARQKSEPVRLSPQLAAKIRANALEVQSELVGGFAEVGARRGGEIGTEIGREHPEWVRNFDPAATPASK